MVVLGASHERMWQQLVIGSLPGEIAPRSACFAEAAAQACAGRASPRTGLTQKETHLATL